MKKIFFITSVLFFINNVSSQSKYVGHYHDFFASTIDINADSTFKYTMRFDLSSSWTKGKWSVYKDTIYFKMIPVYDTLNVIDTVSGIHFLRTFLSPDEKSDLILCAPNYEPLLPSSTAGRKSDSLVAKFGNAITANIAVQSAISGNTLLSGGQNFYPVPDKLFYRANKLYNIKNGKLLKKKFRWSKNKKITPWYIKQK